ncbi:MAG: ATP-binding protein [Spirochaetes bacterium]|nr:MAG: ATP-binding protein [Spirochaetota bacterium]
MAPVLTERLKNNPAVAILGPRQCGKSTLARSILASHKNAVFLDLERPSDLRKIEDIEAFFEINADCLVCLDEVQRAPEIFPALRSILDRSGMNGRLLILGSASRDLLRQSSESLAGRISYLELTPFLLSEVNPGHDAALLRKIWLRGGYPRSYLAASAASSPWRSDFIRTYLERDIPQLGFNIPAASMRRLWTMCAHSHGQTLNYSKIGESLGVSHNTVRSYIDILAQTFLVRILPAYSTNAKKRVIKSPKCYIRDSGLLHSLLEIETWNDLLGHPVYGYSWEGFAMENILSALSSWSASFYRASTGAEIDLILEKGQKRIAVEFKVSSAPELGRGFYHAREALAITESWVIAPVPGPYPLPKNITVAPLWHFIEHMKAKP